MKDIFYKETENLIIRSLELKDMDHYINWYYDEAYRDFFRDLLSVPISFKEKESLFKSIQQGSSTYYISVLKSKSQPIALSVGDFIKLKSSVLRYGMLIDEAYQNKSLALEATIHLLHHFFKDLSARKVVMEFLSSNTHIARILKRGGFLEEARLIQEVYHQGQFMDEDRYYLMKNRFYDVWSDHFKA